MRLAVMNVPPKSSHNANLPVTIANNGRIVNGLGTIQEETYDDMVINNVYENVNYSDKLLTDQDNNDLDCKDIVECSPAEQSASILFVKISNNIYKHNLKPKVINLFIVLAFIIKEKPKFRFSYRAIVKEYRRITNRNINVDTVNKYILILESKGLLKKGENKNYHIGMSNSSLNIEDDQTNYYQEPKSCYTRFYSKIYSSTLPKTAIILEHYISSLPYKRLRRTKVTKDLIISYSTYITTIKTLRVNNFIYRNIIINNNIKYKKMYYYYPIKRRQYAQEYDDYKIINYVNKREGFYHQNQLKTNRLKPHQSRYWYTGAIGEYMRKYKIKYIKAFDNYSIQDAYDIIKELENQIRITNQYQLSAPLIVKAILEAWNWDKIVCDRHMRVKRLEKRELGSVYD